MKNQGQYTKAIKILSYASFLVLISITVAPVSKQIDGKAHANITLGEVEIPEEYTYEKLLIQGMGHLGEAMQAIEALGDAGNLVDLFNEFMESRSGFSLPGDIRNAITKAEFLARTQTGPQIEETQLVEAMHKSMLAALFLKPVAEIEPLAISTTRWVLPDGKEVGMGAWYPWPSTRGMRYFFQNISKASDGLVILNRLSSDIKAATVSWNEDRARNFNFKEGVVIKSKQTLITFNKSALEKLTHVDLPLIQEKRRGFAVVPGLMTSPEGNGNFYPVDALLVTYSLAAGDWGTGESFFHDVPGTQIETWGTTLGDRPYGDQGFLLVRPIKAMMTREVLEVLLETLDILN